MARILPVKLATSSRALWFDANGVEAAKGDAVIVQTARGTEFGTVADPAFEATPEQISSLKTPLKPVCRVATEKDIQTAQNLKQRAVDIMPAYRELVEEEGLDMRPISVEFLFDGDKAVFYFEADDRVDFRELVRKLASRFKIRVDMRQIGPRDEARMIGGIGHCGQELCCKRLGGEFCPVSIRMAKEQDLSLNPQKISGICGRLMCCLRYEYDAYKDFKGRAPKVGAKIETPDGMGKVISLDVPKELVTIQVEADKKISVPLDDMSKTSQEGTRPDTVEKDAWVRASNKEELSVFGEASFVTSQFTSEDKLGAAVAVHRETTGKKEKRRGQGKDSAASARSARNGRSSAKGEAQAQPARKPRRRSTKLSAGEGAAGETNAQMMQAALPASGARGAGAQASQEERTENRRSRTRRSRGHVVIPAAEGQRKGAQGNAAHDAAAHDGAAHGGAAQGGAARKAARGQRSEQEQRSAKRNTAAAGEGGAAIGASAEHRRRRRSGGPTDHAAGSERPQRSQESTRAERAERAESAGAVDANRVNRGGGSAQAASDRAQGAQGKDIRPGRRSSSLRQHPEEKGRAAQAGNAHAGGNAQADGAPASGNANPAKAEEHRSNRRRPRRRKGASGNPAAQGGSSAQGASRSGNAEGGNSKTPGRNTEKGE